MEEKTIKNGFSLIWQGIRMAAVCSFIWVCKSSYQALKDTGLGIVKHPIVALIIIGIMIWQFVCITNQRVERDKNAAKTYRLEQSLDSMKLSYEAVQLRYEKIKKSTSSSNQVD